MRISDMDPEVPLDRGRFEARYLAFLETVAHIRPRLHRYCARMTGSAFDGEDVVQDALFDAYRRFDSYDESRPLAPWLFRIAHHRGDRPPAAPRRARGGRIEVRSEFRHHRGQTACH